MMAGLDVDMMSYAYHDHLAELVESGEVPMALLDEAVLRVLRMKQRLGLFERPYTDPERFAQVALAPEHREIAREMARQSIVLLENDNDVLPLSKDLPGIAVIGRLAESQLDVLGCWRAQGRPEDSVSVLMGIRDALAGRDVEVNYEPAGNGVTSSEREIAAAVKAAREARAVVLVIGEPERLSGEAASRSRIDLPGNQLELARAVLETGTPTAVVIFAGRPLALTELADVADTLVLCWQLGTEHGNAVADVLFGDAAPSGRLPVTFPRSLGQVPLYYNHKRTGRPETQSRFTTKYLDERNEPLYPFGFGLTYTTMQYGNLQVSRERATVHDTVTLTTTLMNTGTRDGVEVVQVYAHDPVAQVTRPVRRLVGFARVPLAAGASRAVSIEIPLSRLQYPGLDLKPTLDPGPVHFYVGPNCATGERVTVEIVAE
jgi:beta-glucosidase